MHWEFIVTLVFAIPVILFPVAYVWYLNMGGAYAAITGRKRAEVAAEHAAAR
jgi:hypothetical protein